MVQKGSRVGLQTKCYDPMSSSVVTYRSGSSQGPPASIFPCGRNGHLSRSRRAARPNLGPRDKAGSLKSKMRASLLTPVNFEANGVQPQEDVNNQPGMGNLLPISIMIRGRCKGCRRRLGSVSSSNDLLAGISADVHSFSKRIIASGPNRSPSFLTIRMSAKKSGSSIRASP